MNEKKAPETLEINKDTKNKNDIEAIIEAKKRRAALLQSNTTTNANPNSNGTNHAKKKHKPYKPNNDKSNNKEIREFKENKDSKQFRENKENTHFKNRDNRFKQRKENEKSNENANINARTKFAAKTQTNKFNISKNAENSVKDIKDIKNFANENLNTIDFVPQISEPPEPQIIPVDIVDNEEKVEIVGVRYKPVGKIYFFSPEDVKYEINDKVIVETLRGIEFGYIVIKNKQIGVSKIVQPLKPIQRRATEDDIERVQNNKKLAKQAIAIAEERVKAHGLKLKIIEAYYTLDNSKLLYSFTAENRIDFRELVKDLASIFKIRIELRQIGIRDQTKIVGGLSICGRPFCCNSFLQDFEQVTIKMAKEQNISINSAKISGACGKLMCCLRYEHETYESLYKDTPRVNSIVETSSGETGVVIESNVLTGICKVRVNVKSNEQAVNTIKPFPKKELKLIGFVKGEQENNGEFNA